MTARMDRNTTRKDILYHSLIAAAGLFCCGIGIYFTLQANIGVSPWDVFHQGLAGRLGMLYGNVSVTVALIIVVVDALLREPIGIGMFLDAFIVGKAVDFCNWLDFLPVQTHLPQSILCMLAGMTITACCMRAYMGCALGCGPRDTLLVALSVLLLVTGRLSTSLAFFLTEMCTPTSSRCSSFWTEPTRPV